MIPVVTPAEMKAIDEAAPVSLDELVRRAGSAVARAALRRMGGAYGRRVVIVAGKGNNGADGRAAGRALRRRGARVVLVEATDAPERLPPADLVIDAAYGTGFRGEYRPPDPGGAAVLAVDIPSGVDGLTGEVHGGALAADVTVAFAALKPGLLLADGPDHAGVVEVADIGLDAGGARVHLVEDGDVASLLPPRARRAHKWNAGVLVVAGSPGMTGAACLAARAALRAGAGMVRLGVPGMAPDRLAPSEAVAVALPASGWAAPALEAANRCRAVVVGPGLGSGDEVVSEVRRLVAEAAVPVVVDGDGLAAFAGGTAPARAPVVLTPHDGEFARLAGGPPRPDRIGDVRSLAGRYRATVLSKGPTTVVAAPAGGVLLAAAGGPRLATAGTGDVLAGVIAAFVAAGMEPLPAAALAAHVHGAAADLGPARGMLAGDLVELLPAWLSARA